jgi:hypothetical protein
MYALDAERLTVWVEAFDPDAGFRAGALCRRHADAMVVPIGWMLDDRREAVPKLFKTRETAEAAGPRQRERRSRNVVADPTGQLELIVVDDHDLEAGTAASADVTDDVSAVDEPADGPAVPWKPTFDQSDDLGGLLATTSPLLSRAFGNLEQRRKR